MDMRVNAFDERLNGKEEDFSVPMKGNTAGFSQLSRLILTQYFGVFSLFRTFQFSNLTKGVVTI